MVTDFEDRLLAMLDELRSTSQIAVDSASEGALAGWLTGPEHARDLIKEATGIHLAPLMTDNFHRYGELRCHWRATGADGAVGGEFWLNHLVNVLVDRVPNDLPEARWPRQERDHDRLRTDCDVHTPDGEERGVTVFDSQCVAGIGAVTGFAEADEGSIIIDEASGQPEIWYHVNTDATLVRLHLTYPEYLEALLLTRGFHGWQYLYADPHDPGFGYCAPDLRRQLDFVERTFPGDDFSTLRSRLDMHAPVHDQRRGG